MMISAKIFLGTDKRVIPRQMLQPLRVPDFGILPMTSRFAQSIYFVTLFGNSSQSTNQQRFVERNSDVPILPVTTSNKICERNYHTTPGLVSFQLSVVLFVVGSAFEAKTNGTLAALFFRYSFCKVVIGQCNQTVGCNRTVEATSHTKYTQLNPPITELITITTATTTYRKRNVEFLKLRNFVPLFLREILVLNIFVVSRNCNGYG